MPLLNSVVYWKPVSNCGKVTLGKAASESAIDLQERQGVARFGQVILQKLHFQCAAQSSVAGDVKDVEFTRTQPRCFHHQPAVEFLLFRLGIKRPDFPALPWRKVK